ncbi:MAG: prolyl oligopeptidase family serine peptidase [Candidatus Neomarinimicrobiota bacterium]
MILISCGSSTPPDTSRLPVTDTYHETEVIDEYRWLEDWDDPNVRKWNEKQNSYARSVLANLPAANNLRKQVSEIIGESSVEYYYLSQQNDQLWAMKWDPAVDQPVLVVIPAIDDLDAQRVVVNPLEIDPDGHTSIDWYVPSPDGRLVAVSLSKSGTESGDVHIFNTATGEEHDEIIIRCQNATAGGDLAWVPDGSGFYYTRYPRPGERQTEDMLYYQQIWYHQLGTTSNQDTYELGDDFPRIAESLIEVDPATGLALVTMQLGDGGMFTHFLRRTSGFWQQFADYDDQIVMAMFGNQNNLLLFSKLEAPRGKILTLSLADLALDKAQLLIPEAADALESDFYAMQNNTPVAVANGNRLYLKYQTGGPSEIRVFDEEGGRLSGPDMLPVSSVGQLVPQKADGILFRQQSYITPPAWYNYAPLEGSTVKTPMAVESSVNYADTEVSREYAISSDGTRVPLNIIKPKNIELDGTNPTILTGYGGYGFSNSPRYSFTKRVWMDQGGIYVIANIRGGGEYGEEWHRQGMLTSKQNVFDDFAAVMHHLVEQSYTSPNQLAIVGGSNGGLLMGAMIVQHPEDFKATVSHVGIYDMLRVELSSNGAFNIPEIGTVKDLDQFKALYAYSPYHNVLDGQAYPAVLFMTGANDSRVDPMQSRKMTARLQAAKATDTPVLLRTNMATGHGGGTPTSEWINQIVDEYAFIFKELGVTYR